MNQISKDVALKFCKVCNWAYEVWITHKYLFDENGTPETNIAKATYFTSRLSVITQEYALQQISKLHDPAIQQSSLNLSIDYVVRFGNWGDKEQSIKLLASQLAELWHALKPARNKVLAHNDLEALLNDTALGAFPKGTDDGYFSALQSLVNEVHEKWLGGPYPFNDLAKADVAEFLLLIEKA